MSKIKNVQLYGTKRTGKAIVSLALSGILLLSQLGSMAKEEVEGAVISHGDGLVIYLDAGHDATHCGAKGYGVREEVANLIITRACKQELEKYEGVTVYMCREEEECPNPGCGSGTDNVLRVYEASDCEADLYVALHLNWSYRSSNRGAEVFYPNTNYNSSLSKKGKAVSKSILKRLKKLGLYGRGVTMRTSSSTRYPDGSMADYYSVIRNSKLLDMPGIIVEHAFLSNRSDVSRFLDTAEKLEQLGVADAKGIVDYYGLTPANPAAVTLERVSQQEDGNVLLSWREYENADYYAVYRRQEGSVGWELLSNTTEEGYVDLTSVGGITYYYTVQAHDAVTGAMSEYHPTGFSISTVIVE